ncbi:response regulator [Jannaschia donghaensis]|uniref:Response regulator n=2 Tax=Jannaschia donghaensis TaxID=420998 RepID=A0A0M6YFE2_9RHOB|nr:response regulator [Jannaschia donghaensis]
MLDDFIILLVEDEAMLALDLSMSLEDEGAQVTGPFASVDTALPACAARLDAAILDVDLCGGKSFPIADRLSADGVPFVFHTGRSDLDVLRDRYGDNVPILVKPARAAEVIHALETILPAA